jgi:leader peptidase (prepilin peptidase)/N-methyltransferase
MTLVGGAAIGMAVGALLVPFTRRQLAASVARSARAESPAGVENTEGFAVPVATWHRIALVAASGLIPGYVLHQVGWSLIALPPLILLLGLVQLAYCDLTRGLLPKTLVYAVSASVVVSGIVIAGVMHEWQRLEIASLAGAAFFALLFVMNLVNPRWIAFGDVRLSLVVGFALAWVSLIALLEGFLYANIFAAVVGLGLIVVHRADRKSAVPFGVYLAFGTALVLLTWS